MATSYFTRTGAGFLPSELAVGPWADDMLHGRLLGGLAARAVEREHLEPGRRVARLTVDMFRPAGLDPVSVTTDVVRRGRRIVVVDAELVSGGAVVGSTRAIVLAEGEPPPGRIWQAPTWESPHPETLPVPERHAEEDRSDFPWKMRIHQGGFGSDDRARVWTNETGHLVDDEPVSPLVRAALTGDIASPLANGSAAGIGYINADYTLAMARYPTSDWIGVEATTHLAADGIALGACTLYDLDGPFATSTTTALANPVLQ